MIETDGFKSDSLEGLIDPDRLAAWLDAHDVAAGTPLEIRRLAAGMSNESFVLHRGGRRWVLRRPARVALEGADRGMQREHRVLTALEGTPVPHPSPLALCADREVIGSAFYVMEYVAGFSSLDPLPARFAGDPVLQEQVALAYMEAIGELARVDWRARGLEGWGRPDGFHERQVERWTRQLDGYGARELPGIREVGAWLSSHIPADWTPGIMHGDYHSANVLVAPDPPGRVAAILDWENSTIGDPVLDLAAFLRMWGDGERRGWAPREAMIERWEQHSGRRAPDLRYYTALSAFRLAVLLEGVYQRALADPTRAAPEQMGAHVLHLVSAARSASGA